MAERFQRQSFITPRVAQTGDLASLSLRLRAISNVVSSAATFQSQLDFRGRQNQQAAVKAYQGSVSNDILEGVSRIQAESFTEAEFNKKVGEFRTGMFTDVPPEFQDQFTQIFDNIETRSRIQLQGADVERVNEENKVLTQQGLTGFSKQATKAAFGGDLATLEFSRDNFISLLDNPRFTASEIGEFIQELDKELEEQLVLGKIDSLYTEDPRKALIAISAFSESKDLDMEPDEQKRITALAWANVNNRTKQAEAVTKIADDETEARIKANEEDLSAKAYAGELTEVEFIQAIRDRDIDAKAADRVRKRMNNATAVRDNPDALIEFRATIADLSPIEAELQLDVMIDNGLLTGGTAAGLLKEVQIRDQKEEDQAIKIERDLLKQIVKPLTGPGSALLDPQAEAKSAFAMAEFNRRAAEGEDPTAVREEIMGIFANGNQILSRNLPPLRFGTIDNLQEAETLVLQAREKLEITEEEGERQLELIRIMSTLNKSPFK